MAGTTLKDVIVPELFNPYVINHTAERSALLNLGLSKELLSLMHLLVKRLELTICLSLKI